MIPQFKRLQHLGLFADKAELQIAVISGVLRVSIRPRLRLASLLIAAAFTAFVAAISIGSWRQSSLTDRIFEVVVILATLFGWFQQLSGSEEEIEIGEREIRISKEIFGWKRVSEFPIDQCSDLDLTKEEDSRRLQFRFGKWRTIEFGNYLSKEQAEEILDTLADSLPQIGQKLLPSLDITKHWTTLRLN